MLCPLMRQMTLQKLLEILYNAQTLFILGPKKSYKNSW